MRVATTLWGARGTRGVNDVGKVVRPAAGRRGSHRWVVGRAMAARLFGIHEHSTAEPSPEGGFTRLLLVSRTLGAARLPSINARRSRGYAGVQGQVGAAGLERAQQGHHHLHRTLQADAHQLLRTDAQPDQVLRQAVGRAFSSP